jgi:threonine dehydrogenase-like Zn-dependent dehydrogenase
VLAEGMIDPTEIVTHRMPLAQAREAYDLFSRREATKVMLQP